MNRHRQIPILVILALLVGGLAAFWHLRHQGPPLPPVAGHEDSAQEGHDEHDEHEGHPEEEGRIHLTLPQQREAGIRVAPAQAEPLVGGTTLTGTLEGDPDLEVRLSARVQARVETLSASVGDRVVAGQVLAILDSPEVARAKADAHEAQVELDLARRNLDLRRQLARLGDESRAQSEEAGRELASALAARDAAEAVLEQSRLRGARVESLLQDGIASSQQAEEARSELRQAEAGLRRAREEVRIAEARKIREAEISRGGYRQSREVHEAEASVRRARERAAHLQEAVTLLGADTRSHGSNLTLTAPMAGIVVERAASRGEQVEAGSELFRILETSNLWLWLNLHQGDLSRVREGMEVRVEVAAVPGRVFQGRISYIAPTLDAQTRTARARVEIPNRDGALKPQMFASVQALESGREPVVTVPETALQEVEGQEVVYVARSAVEFERRVVVPGQRAQGRVEIRQGLSTGEKVAVSGAFSLKSEDLKETMGEGHAH
jgi:cobalt-zinc-cadmium efflux system membrane fusion protein